MKHTNITLLAAAVIMAFSIGCSGLAGSKSFDGYYPTSANAPIAVSNATSGNLIVNSWQESAVGVSALATMRTYSTFAPGTLDDITLSVDTNSGVSVNAVSLRETYCTIDIKVSMPTNGLLTNVWLTTGNLEMRSTRGDCTAHVTTGRVDIRTHAGALAVIGTTGMISVLDVTGAVNASMTTSMIKLKNIGALGRVVTTTGAVECDVKSAATNARVETTTGSVTLYIADTLNANFDVETVVGGIDTRDVALSDKVISDKNVVGKRMTARAGSGGNVIYIRVTTGSVTLERLR